MRLPLALVGLTLGLATAGLSPVHAEASLVECDRLSAAEVLCVLLPSTDEGGSMHQFFSRHGSNQDQFLTAVSGQAEMAFSTGCPGTPTAGQVCLQLTGSASGSALTPGDLIGTLGHMDDDPCSWGPAGGSCSFAFKDGSSTIHKHWHTKDGTWQCHDGTAKVVPLTGNVEATFRACWKYGPWTGLPSEET